MHLPAWLAVASLHAEPVSATLPFNVHEPVVRTLVIAPPPVRVPLAAEPDEGAWRKLSVVSVALLGAQIVTLSVLTQFPASSTGWGDGSFDNILRHDLEGPLWDGDPWYWNYVTHPLAGAEYYLLARNRGATWYGSLGYAAGMSAFWEGVTEAYYERPSGQDLLVTPLAGAIIGEVRYQVKAHLLEGQGRHAPLWRVIAAVILDPVDALTGGL
jgi:hypothetical protein